MELPHEIEADKNLIRLTNEGAPGTVPLRYGHSGPICKSDGERVPPDFLLYAEREDRIMNAQFCEIQPCWIDLRHYGHRRSNIERAAQSSGNGVEAGQMGNVPGAGGSGLE